MSTRIHRPVPMRFAPSLCRECGRRLSRRFEGGRYTYRHWGGD